MTRRLLGLLVLLPFAIGHARAPRSMIVQSTVQQTPSSYELIARALAAGQIDEETAHKYRVFAAFGHHGLPQQYQGDDSRVSEPPSSVLRAGALLHTFSAATQAELRPFFLTPAMPGSWVELTDTADLLDDAAYSASTDAQTPTDEGVHAYATSPVYARRTIRWHTVLAAGGKVKIWAMLHHAGDSAKAETIAREMTSTMWPRLVPLLGPPRSDMADPLNSGGPELDIFLVRPTAAKMAQLAGRPGVWEGLANFATPGKCQDAAFFLLVDSRHPLGSATSKGLLQIVAHEFAHALTGAKPLKGGDCIAYDWMTEATATWAEHKTYPKAQTEHAWPGGFLADVSVTLDESSPPGDFNMRAYQSYLFPLHLQLNEAKDAAIGAIWNSFRSNDLRHGIVAGLRAHGLEIDQVFPRFAVHNLNQASVDEYNRLDQVIDKPNINDDHQVSIPAGKTEYEKAIALKINDLATHYVRFEFDQSVRMVTFENTLVPMGYAGVWIVPQIAGAWKTPVDLTKQYSTTWCRDNPLENVDELIFVFTNNEWRDTTRLVETSPNFEPMLRAYPDDCGRGWTGTSKLVNTIISNDPAIQIVETVTTTIRFAVDSALIAPGQPREYWKSVGGQINWQVQVSGACTGTGAGSVTIRNQPAEHAATLRIWTEAGTRHYSGSSGEWPGNLPQYNINCQGQTMQQVLFGALGFFATDSDNDVLPPGALSFGGKFTNQPQAGNTVEHSYSFRCASGC